MSRQSELATLALAATVGCAAVSASRPSARSRSSLPAATRTSDRVGVARGGDGPVAVQVASVDAEAEALRDRLREALLQGDTETMRGLFADTVEASSGARVNARGAIVERLALWQPALAQGLARGHSTPLHLRLIPQRDCTASACGDAFLRDGDWLLVLEHPMLQRRVTYRPRIRSTGGRHPLGGPPLFFVLRAQQDRTLIVAANDELFEES